VVKTGRLAWLVWVIGVFAYAAAIMQRTSLGVLGQQTSDHFGTSVSIISTFVMVQLATYAIAQTPVGVLVDRYGSRTVMICGSDGAGDSPDDHGLRRRPAPRVRRADPARPG